MDLWKMIGSVKTRNIIELFFSGFPALDRDICKMVAAGHVSINVPQAGSSAMGRAAIHSAGQIQSTGRRVH